MKVIKGKVMFVSSYSTYINTNATERTQKERADKGTEKTSTFSTKLSALSMSTADTLALKKQLPINYVPNYKVLNNQQKLQQANNQEFTNTKFTKISAQQSAQVAYSDNSQLFSRLIKPKLTLDQTPKLDTKLPPKAQEAQEKSLRHTMINTYISNDNYYKITA
jgi:hypothetical protein